MAKNSKALLYISEGGFYLNFTCKCCGNSDERYVGYLNGKPYCRKCIPFKGTTVEYKKKKGKDAPIEIPFALSPEQAQISESILNNFKKGIDTLVYAVCGSGKTEISYGVISYAIYHGLTVGFALPRRDVVIELFYRLKEAFPKNKIVAVFGQHNDILEGDIIILTTHQLYRYKNYFDLLVMDEIDAFPFKDNSLLFSMYERARRGSVVLMSATPSDKVLNEFKKEGHEILELRTRFHKKEIPVPKIVIYPSILKVLFIVKKLKKYKKENKVCFIFTPSIAKCEALFNLLKIFIENGDYVHSKRENRGEIIGKFKKNEFLYLVTTSVLERGVTFKNLQVVVTDADEESIYNSATLIQIAGRVGRKIGATEGDVIFLAEKETSSMRRAIDEIKFCNTFL